eukprot:COSAG01_NODE_736_length_13947_cov_174.337449_13_plen_45_part_00
MKCDLSASRAAGTSSIRQILATPAVSASTHVQLVPLLLPSPWIW